MSRTVSQCCHSRSGLHLASAFAGRRQTVPAVTARSKQQQRSQRRIAVAALTSNQLQQPIDAVLFDLDAVARGLEMIITAWAFDAASSTCDIAGTASLYTQHLQQLLPVLQEPYEAALLLRLLHDEGIVGARSTSGREGPVVGRPVRHSGSRPLLLNELLEHWQDEIKPTYLLRWSCQSGASTTELEQQLRTAYHQAQQSVPWQVLDVEQQHHGSSSCSRHPPTSKQTTARTAAASAATGPSTVPQSLPAPTDATGSNTSNSSSNSPLAVAVAAPPKSDTEPTAAPESSPEAVVSDRMATAVVQPYVSVVPTILSCRHDVYIASTYPAAVTQAVLSALQLVQPAAAASLQVLHGACMQDCIQQFLQQQQQQRRERGNVLLQVQHAEPTGSNSGGGGRRGSNEAVQHSSRQALIVLSSPDRAANWEHLLQQQQHPQQQQQQQQYQQEQQQHAGIQPLQVSMQVAEWACRAPSLKAKALGAPHLGLLSEFALAEMMGVAECDAVMDGIAWR